MNLGALIQQPTSSTPPEQQGSSGSSDATSVQALMQSKGGTGGAQPPGGGQPMQAPAPTHQQAVAALKHISAFDSRWRQMMADPGIGKKSVRGKIYETMADLMGDGYCTLPQAMTLLKTFPAEPLEQKQWLEKHIQQDEQAMMMLMQHHASANPDGPVPEAGGQPGLADDHLDMMSSLGDHYRERSPKKPAGAIPMRRSGG